MLLFKMLPIYGARIRKLWGNSRPRFASSHGVGEINELVDGGCCVGSKTMGTRWAPKKPAKKYGPRITPLK